MLSSVSRMMSFFIELFRESFFVFMLQIPKPHAAMWAQAPGIQCEQLAENLQDYFESKEEFLAAVGA